MTAVKRAGLASVLIAAVLLGASQPALAWPWSGAYCGQGQYVNADGDVRELFVHKRVRRGPDLHTYWRQVLIRNTWQPLATIRRYC